MILGIDPGLHGGFAVVDGRALVLAQAFPVTKENGRVRIDGRALAAALWLAANQHLVTHAWVEAVGSRPRQAGQFAFGLNTGIVHGILHACGVSFSLVSPVSWKAAFGLKRAENQKTAEVKAASRAMAARCFPAHAELFSRVKDDGVAEAALIALYGAIGSR